MSVLNQQNILQLSCKYLNSMGLIDSASIHTLRAYAKDISDFLEPILELKLQVKITDDQFKISIVVLKSNKTEKIAQDDLSAKSHQKLLKIEQVRQKFPKDSTYFKPNDVEFSGEKLLKGLLKIAQKKWAHLSLATKNRKYATLKSFFGWLNREDYIETQLNHFVQMPKVPRKLPNYVSVDDALLLIKTLQETLQEASQSHGPRDFALITLLYGSGLRVSEACQLKWKDIDFNNQSLRILGKGGKQRMVTPVPICFTALKHLDQETLYIFGQTPLSTRTAYDICKKWGAKIGLLKPLNPHALRHSFATHLLSSGANLRILQDLLGHSSLTATEKYTHLTTDELARTLNKHHPLGNKE